MTERRVAAVGGSPTFHPVVARALGSAPDDVQWLPSVASAEHAIGDVRQSYDVVVLAPSVKDDEAMSLAEFTTKEAPGTAVILARDAPVDGAFPRLVRSGLRDVVDLSRGGAELNDALRRALEWAASVRGELVEANGSGGAARAGAIVSVFSTKGGTGKTFLACNIAAALADRTGSDVALLDLDHDLGDVFAFFQADPRRTLHDLLQLEEGADHETVARLGTSLAPGVTGFGSPPDPRAEAIPGASMTRMLRTLKEAFAFTVVDATSEYSDHVLASLDLSDVICLVSGLDAIGVRHMSLAIQTLRNLGVPAERLRIVINRANSKVDLTTDDIERLVGVKIDAKIPSSPIVARSINRGRLLWADERRSDVVKAVETFADALGSQLGQPAVESQPKPRRFGRGR